jgi:hypothetical protein
MSAKNIKENHSVLTSNIELHIRDDRKSSLQEFGMESG